MTSSSVWNHTDAAASRSSEMSGPNELGARTSYHDELTPDFESFLQIEKIPLARALAAWLWSIDDFSPISSAQLELFVERERIMELVIESAPWDGHFIAFASRTTLRRMGTSWFVAVAFGEPERVRSAAEAFQRFCRRQGLRDGGSRIEAREADLMAVDLYLRQWQHQIARRLIGPVLDRIRSVRPLHEFDDGIAF